MSNYEKEVRIAMAKRGIRTFTELADKLGVSQAYVSDAINGNRKATNLRQKINDFLEIEGD